MILNNLCQDLISTTHDKTSSTAPSSSTNNDGGSSSTDHNRTASTAPVSSTNIDGGTSSTDHDRTASTTPSSSTNTDVVTSSSTEHGTSNTDHGRSSNTTQYTPFVTTACTFNPENVSEKTNQPKVDVEPIVLPNFFRYVGIVFLVVATFMTITCVIYWILLPRTYLLSAVSNPPFSQTIPHGSYIATMEMTD